VNRILIIEDSEGVALIWRRYLAPLGFPVEVAPTWKDAVKALQEIPPPNLVFLDLHLPDSPTANKTLAKIRTIQGYNPDAVIVVVTGLVTGDKIAQLAREMGADGFRFKNQIESQRALLNAARAVLVERRDKSPRGLAEAGLSILEKISQLVPLET
jgi:CheY-like chemotaxis protein